MFDIELTKIVLKRKENDLQALQNSQSPNQEDIDVLTKEVNYLKAVIVRYEIAQLLKLNTNQEYMTNNFIGIENENPNDYNLTPDELTRFNDLLSKLPQEQLTNYRIRRQITKIIGEENSKDLKKDDYVGIEKINPKLDKYNLSDEQINDFNTLVDQINNSVLDTTKRVDIYQETLKILEESFNKLNVENVSEYNRLKLTYMDTVTTIIDHIQEESRKKIHGKAKNFRYGLDMREKYPELDVILDVSGAKQLLDLISRTRLDEDKYNDYLTYLCDSIKKLYEDENNRANIVNLINSVDRNNVPLRKDLINRLPSDLSTSLTIQDNELEGLFRYLDRNYDSLDENVREKCYSMLETKLNNDINNLNRINIINNLMLSLTNKSFGERLQKKFASNDIVKFSHHHFTSHQQLIDDKIKVLRDKIKKLENKKPKTGILASHYDIKIKDLEKEIQRLESINEHTSDSSLLSTLDNSYNKKTDRIIELRKEIEELNQIKSNINSKFHKKIIAKKIEKRNKKIAKLQKSKTKIVGRQKKIMTPKLFVNRKRGLFSRHYESRSEVFNDYSEGYREMASVERSLHGMFSGIKAAFYDFRSGRYNSKSEFNRDICDRLRNRNVRVNGRNRHLINRNRLAQARNNQNQQVATQTM